MTAANASRKWGSVVLSTLWRGVAGFLLFEVVFVVVHIVAYIGMVFFNKITGDHSIIDEYWVGVPSSVAGTLCGIGAMDRVLKRYPARTIAWVSISIFLFFFMVSMAIFVFVVSGVLSLPEFTPQQAWRDLTDPLNILNTIVGLTNTITLYIVLIRPNRDLMKEVGGSGL